MNSSDTTHLNEIADDFQPGTLADYLGFRGMPKEFLAQGDDNYFPVLPFYAYHLIWDYWYRNKLVQKSIFDENFATSNSIPIARSPMRSFTKANYILPMYGYDQTNGTKPFADGSSIFSLRQRNFDSDYFTTATLSPQLGVAQSVKLPVQNTQGTMSIASLRAANSLQQFAERNNLAGIDDVNYYKAMYGAHLDYGVAQHPVCLGSVSVPIYVNGTSSGRFD